MNQRPPISVEIVLPVLRTSGGTLEALRLARDLEQAGVRSTVVTIWDGADDLPAELLPTQHLSLTTFLPKKSTALMVLPFAYLRYWRHRRRIRSRLNLNRSRRIAILTHYSTFVLAALLPATCCWVYVQDLEWGFFPSKILRRLARAAILGVFRRSRVIAANEYLASELSKNGISCALTMPIWADALYGFSAEPIPIQSRENDIVMMIRSGDRKRPDLYFDLIRLLQRDGISRLRVRAIAMSSVIADEVRSKGIPCEVLPSREEMHNIYCNSKIFVLLSEREGFGLPPLEAMGSGCVPICRDSGGIRQYLDGALANLMLPLSASNEDIATRLETLLGTGSDLDYFSAAVKERFHSGLRETDRLRKLALNSVREL